MDKEIEAMSKVAQAIDDLEDEARVRVLKWAADRFGISLATQRNRAKSDRNSSDAKSESEYDSLAELFADAAPSSGPLKVLVAGYWHQEHLGVDRLTSAMVNSDLKDLGHGINSINKCFDSLMKEKPQLAIQIKKSGTSKQARKEYKITKAGIRAVTDMLAKTDD